ncbi:hypothetical protein H5410_004926 [Solanum commersonii]|uniref:TF-B3 domain-containing protein n=1 Tax=Solanum commersonii TaxID=4109 RepID=A0A9J6A672_SOLCO|nr:hypothetical protein H5410_004926 [Solanum commersonii]
MTVNNSLCHKRNFCDFDLSKYDDVLLVDENEEIFVTKYLIGKNGLSRGWKGFSNAHNFLEKDALDYQLIRLCKV